jgi:phosphoglycolate phosphatase-like HAD superfamily hydrolase
MLTHATHIVWDWNGTLLHDIEAVLAASNASFAEIGLPPLTLERYQELYCVPVPKFYQRLLGRLPSAQEWEVLNEAFHQHYWALAPGCALTEGAAELLAARQAAGHTQSMCSLAPHDLLVPIATTHGITERFTRIDGSTDRPGHGKADQMARHLAAREGVDPGHTVVIGDALDDASAAAHVGAHAVLYTGGSHSRAALESAGVPVVDTLAAAVAEADRLIASGGIR